MSATNSTETPPGVSSCVNCDRPDSADNLVQCDRCLDWWHMSCAGVTDSVENRPWSCRKCLPVTSDSTDRTYRSLVSSSTTSSKRHSLTMMKLKEEYEMKMKQLKDQQELERRFHEQKYACLEAALEEDDCSSIRSRISDAARRRKAQQWVDTMPLEVDEAAAAALPAATSGPDQSKGAIPKTALPKPIMLEQRQSKPIGAQQGLPLIMPEQGLHEQRLPPLTIPKQIIPDEGLPKSIIRKWEFPKPLSQQELANRWTSTPVVIPPSQVTF